MNELDERNVAQPGEISPLLKNFLVNILLLFFSYFSRIRSNDKKTVLSADNLKSKLNQLNDKQNETLLTNTKSLLNLTAKYNDKLKLDIDEHNNLSVINTVDIDLCNISNNSNEQQCRSSALSCNKTTNKLWSNGLRKRNVNWDLNNLNSVKQNELDSNNVVVSNKVQLLVSSAPLVKRLTRQTGEDDGFESLNGRSSGEDNNNILPTPPQPSLLFPLSKQLRAPTIPTDSETDCIRRDIRNAHQSIDTSIDEEFTNEKKLQKSTNHKIRGDSTDTDDDEEGGDDDRELIMQSPTNVCKSTDAAASSTAEWIGITTNSEDCSYNSSEIEHSASQYENSENGGEYELTPAVLLNPISGSGDRSIKIFDFLSL